MEYFGIFYLQCRVLCIEILNIGFRQLRLFLRINCNCNIRLFLKADSMSQHPHIRLWEWFLYLPFELNSLSNWTHHKSVRQKIPFDWIPHVQICTQKLSQNAHLFPYSNAYSDSNIITQNSWKHCYSLFCEYKWQFPTPAISIIILQTWSRKLRLQVLLLCMSLNLKFQIGIPSFMYARCLFLQYIIHFSKEIDIISPSS